MDWITEHLALGNWSDCQDHAYLQANGVEAVLQLHGPDPSPDPFPFARAYLQLPVVDARPLPVPYLRQGVDFIREQRALDRKVLVACSAGMSRSPTFLAAYLHEEGLPLDEAFQLILRQRRIIPHPALLQSLIGYYGAPLTASALNVAIARALARRR